jgi:hypothetical protein
MPALHVHPQAPLNLYSLQLAASVPNNRLVLHVDASANCARLTWEFENDGPCYHCQKLFPAWIIHFSFLKQQKGLPYFIESKWTRSSFSQAGALADR